MTECGLQLLLSRIVSPQQAGCIFAFIQTGHESIDPARDFIAAAEYPVDLRSRLDNQAVRVIHVLVMESSAKSALPRTSVTVS